MDYVTVLESKISSLKDILLSKCQNIDITRSYDDASASEAIVKLEIIESDKQHHRHRCRFQILKSPDIEGSDVELSYALWVNGVPTVLEHAIKDPSAGICHVMPLLLRFCELNPTLYLNLEAVNFLSTISGEVLISLIYSQPIEPESWLEIATALQSHIISHSMMEDGAILRKVNIVGRSKGVQLVIGHDHVWEALPVPSSVNKVIKLKQILDGFSSPNAMVNARALDWICQNISSLHSNYHDRRLNLLELYCGNGNHTVALASIFHHIIAIELNHHLCNIARENLEANGSIKNVDIVHIDSQHFAQKLLKDLHYITQDGKEYEFDMILVDPPRAGLDDSTRELVCYYDRIIYISCNPEALVRDLNLICLSHDIVSAALFDQFPDTRHNECGLLLRRKATVCI